MNTKQEFISVITGGTSTGVILACLFFAFLGFLLNICIKVNRRDINSKRTPQEFSWKFFLSDNSNRFIISTITNTIVVFVSLRFSVELFNSELNPFFSFITGLTLDGAIGKITDYIKKK